MYNVSAKCHRGQPDEPHQIQDQISTHTKREEVASVATQAESKQIRLNSDPLIIDALCGEELSGII